MDETVNEAELDPPYTPMMRMRAVVDTDRLDIAALIWMTGVLIAIGAFRLSSTVLYDTEFVEADEILEPDGL